MNYTNKVITIDSEKKYIVIEQVNYDKKTYLYMSNDSDSSDSMFVEIKDGDILEIDPKLFNDKILPLFVEKIKNN